MTILVAHKTYMGLSSAGSTPRCMHASRERGELMSRSPLKLVIFTVPLLESAMCCCGFPQWRRGQSQDSVVRKQTTREVAGATDSKLRLPLAKPRVRELCRHSQPTAVTQLNPDAAIDFNVFHRAVAGVSRSSSWCMHAVPSQRWQPLCG